MKKNTTKIFIAAIFLTISGTAYAQEGRVGINTSTPAATLDVVASPSNATRIDGFIAPRLKGSELKAKDALYTTAQEGAIVYVTEAVSGVTDKTTNVTSIGYYYFDKTQGTAGRWMKIANPTAVGAYQEPWNVQSSSTPATTNNQAIYQNGAVSIWRNKVFESTASGSAKVDLHVNGATRVGGQDPDVAKSVGGNSFAGGNAPVASGNNSMAYGTSVEASGTNSAAFGNNSKAVGTESFAIGNNTTAAGAQSFAGGGNGSTATGQYAFAFGNGAKAIGNHAVAMGVGTIAPARSSVTLGRYNVNTFTSADITQNSPGDPIFQVGAGADDARRYNIITTFLGTNGTTGVGGGWMAIGGDLNTMPVKVQDETLRVYGAALSNKAYVTDINSVTGASTDKLVVADATTGQLKTIAASSVNTAYQEPWVVQGGTTPATTNLEAISQNASVAIGKSSAYNSTNQAMLDVAGAVRTGSGQTGVVGTDSVAMGSGNTASGNQSVALGQNTTSSGSQSFSIGNGNVASGNGSFAGGYWSTSGATASGNSSFAFGANGATAAGDYSFAFGNSAKTVSSSANSLAFGSGAATFFNHGLAIGVGTISPVRSGIALGRFNRYTDQNFTTGSNSANTIGDPIFQVGQGSSNGTRANIITGYYGMNGDGSFGNGWVVIGANPTNTESIRLGTEALTVYGKIASTGGINAGGSINGSVSTYPDYVFQNYYNGNSTLNSNYKFTNLYETEKFIKENHHLPGVTSVNELEKTENGYLINIGTTATQALEKAEELYLHTIEQQKQIDELKDIVKQQQKQINQLLKK